MVRVRVAHTQTPGARQTAGEEACAELERMWVEFNTSASATATNLNDAINEGPANSTQDILEAICARWGDIIRGWGNVPFINLSLFKKSHCRSFILC